MVRMSVSFGWFYYYYYFYIYLLGAVTWVSLWKPWKLKPLINQTHIYHCYASFLSCYYPVVGGGRQWLRHGHVHNGAQPRQHRLTQSGQTAGLRGSASERWFPVRNTGEWPGELLYWPLLVLPNIADVHSQ